MSDRRSGSERRVLSAGEYAASRKDHFKVEIHDSYQVSSEFSAGMDAARRGLEFDPSRCEEWKNGFCAVGILKLA